MKMSDIYERTCRLCMHVGGSLISIYSEDELSNISETIMACVPLVTISENDDLPKNICLKCSVRLNDAFTFKQQCENSDTILRNLSSALSHDINMEDKNVIDITNEQQCEIIDPKKYVDCTLRITKKNNIPNYSDLWQRRNNKIPEERTENNAVLPSSPSESNNYIKEETVELLFKEESKNENTSRLDDLKVIQSKEICNNKYSKEVTEKVTQRKLTKNNRLKRRYIISKLKIKKYKCNVCNNEEFSTIKELKVHRSTHEGPFKCKHCKRDFLTWIARVNHERTHNNDNKSTQCNICFKVFKTFKSLSRHKFIHTGLMKKSCPLCGKEFAHKGNLTRHMLTHEDIKPYVCEICYSRFTQAGSLKDHINICHSLNIERHACPICKYSNVRKTALRAHMTSKHLVRVDSDAKAISGGRKLATQNYFKCGVCDKSLCSPNTLKIHMKTHTELKEYLCRHCGRSFRSKTGLDTHERTHTGEKPYMCKLCSKRFTQQIGLSTHILTHTGEKPHKCKVCSKCFSQGSHLTTHMKTHTGERKHVCDICNKAFAQREGLRYHKMTHTGETPFVCQFCGRGFYIQYKLKVHLDKSHGVQMQVKHKDLEQDIQKSQESIKKEDILV